jgi:hypothetical protein
LFSRRKEKHQERIAQLEAQVEHLRSLDSIHLADEVMSGCRAFAPDFDCITTGGLAEQFCPRVGMLRGPAVEALSQLVDEGAQTLINAGLLADGGWGGAGDGNAYTVTRAGRTALADGTVHEALASAPSS